MQEQSIVYMDGSNIFTDFFTYNEKSQRKRKILGATSNIDRIDIDFLSYICENSERVYIEGVFNNLETRSDNGNEEPRGLVLDTLFDMDIDIHKLMSYMLYKDIRVSGNSKVYDYDNFLNNYNTKLDTKMNIIRQLDVYMLYSYSKVFKAKYREEMERMYIQALNLKLIEAETELSNFKEMHFKDGDKIPTRMELARIKDKATSLEDELYQLYRKENKLRNKINNGLRVLKGPFKLVYGAPNRESDEAMLKVAQRNHYCVTISMLGIQAVILDGVSLDSYYEHIGYDTELMNDNEYRKGVMFKSFKACIDVKNRHKTYTEGRKPPITELETKVAGLLGRIFKAGSKNILLLNLGTAEITFAVDHSVDIQCALLTIAEAFRHFGLDEFLSRVSVYSKGRLQKDDVLNTESSRNINIKNIEKIGLDIKYYATTEEEIGEYKRAVDNINNQYK